MIRFLVCAVVSLTLFAATQLKAASPNMIQVEFIQWLVQLSGDSGSLPPTPTTSDYVSWAQNQGLTPVGGWRPDHVLTRDVLAQVLVQYFNLSAKPGQDPIIILRREGIDLPGTPNDSTISRAGWTTLVDLDGLQSRSLVIYKNKHSKHKTPKDPKPGKGPKAPEHNPNGGGMPGPKLN